MLTACAVALSFDIRRTRAVICVVCVCVCFVDVLFLDTSFWAESSPDNYVALLTSRDEVLVWLSVWSEVQIVCILSSWCHCRPQTPSSLASFKSRLVLPFWYRLIQVVLEPLNGCSSRSSSFSSCYSLSCVIPRTLYLSVVIDTACIVCGMSTMKLLSIMSVCPIISCWAARRYWSIAAWPALSKCEQCDVSWHRKLNRLVIIG